MALPKIMALPTQVKTSGNSLKKKKPKSTAQIILRKSNGITTLVSPAFKASTNSNYPSVPMTPMSAIRQSCSKLGDTQTVAAARPETGT